MWLVLIKVHISLGELLSLPAPSLPLLLFPDTRWCHGSLLECKCVPNTASVAQIPPICHRTCSLATALGPKLVSEQDILAV